MNRYVEVREGEFRGVGMVVGDVVQVIPYADIVRMLNARAEPQPAAGRFWVPVSEGTPVEGERYFAKWRDGHSGSCVWNTSCRWPVNVTHYAEIPPLPGEVGDGK